MQSDKACIASHQFKHHHTVMRFGCGMQTVDGFGGGVDGGIKSEGGFRAADIIIDRLGDADDRRAFLI